MSLQPARLSKDQRDLIRRVLSAGCDRAAAVKAASATLQQLNSEMRRNADYAKSLLKAEGGAEFLRMNTLHEAAKEIKLWRAAAWWLEQQEKRRRARLKAKQVTVREWEAYVRDIVHAIMSEVSQEAERERLVVRLQSMFGITDSAAETPEGEPHD